MAKKLLTLAVLMLAVMPLILIGSMVRTGLSARVKPNRWEAWMATRLRSLAMPITDKQRTNPFSANEEILKEAREHFADHCAICHGNNGGGNTAIGQGLSPQAPDMRLAATQSKSDGELYSIIHSGIRFSGMPAWGADGKDDDSWKLVLFIRHLPRLTAEDIKDMENYNPKSKAERIEEQEEEDFLSGKSSGSSSDHRVHQHE